MGDLNITLLSLNKRHSSPDKKHNLSLRLVLFFPFLCCFAGSIQSSTAKQMKLFNSNFQDVFLLFLREKHFEKTVSLWMSAKCVANCERLWKAGILGQAHTPLWLLIGRIIFLTREKTSFAILIGLIILFTCENHRSFLWLARTHLLMNVYDIAFWWVFLSMYRIHVNLHKVLNFDGKIRHNWYGIVYGFCLCAIAGESCTKFYVPDKNSPLTLGVCDGGSCKCVSSKLEQTIDPYIPFKSLFWSPLIKVAAICILILSLLKVYTDLFSLSVEPLYNKPRCKHLTKCSV